MQFSWTKGQTEEVFARVHGIASIRRSAFQARLRHLQRLGVPPGTNTGKGKAASYGPPQITILGLALELLQLGLSPERAATILAAEHDHLLAQMTHAASAIIADEYTGGQQLLLVDPGGLSDLQSGNTPKAGILSRGPANQLPEYLADAPKGYKGHFSVIDLRWLAAAICRAAAALDLGDVRRLSWAFTRMLWREGDEA